MTSTCIDFMGMQPPIYCSKNKSLEYPITLTGSRECCTECADAPLLTLNPGNSIIDAKVTTTRSVYMTKHFSAKIKQIRLPAVVSISICYEAWLEVWWRTHMQKALVNSCRKHCQKKCQERKIIPWTQETSNCELGHRNRYLSTA